MAKTRKQLRKKLDKLWREHGKETARCEICETLPPEERVNYTVVHPHHVVGRKNATLRFDLRNKCNLCPYHHVFGNTLSAHNDPLGFAKWFKEHRLEDYIYLQQKKNEITKWKISDLHALIKEYEIY